MQNTAWASNLYIYTWLRQSARNVRKFQESQKETEKRTHTHAHSQRSTTTDKTCICTTTKNVRFLGLFMRFVFFCCFVCTNFCGGHTVLYRGAGKKGVTYYLSVCACLNVYICVLCMHECVKV